MAGIDLESCIICLYQLHTGVSSGTAFVSVHYVVGKQICYNYGSVMWLGFQHALLLPVLLGALSSLRSRPML